MGNRESNRRSVNERKRIVFADRDGCIVYPANGKYLNRTEDTVFYPGAMKALRKLNEAGIPVIIVTNQAGPALGHMDHNTCLRIQEDIVARINSEGGNVVDWYMCMHDPKDNCLCRKPNILFGLEALKKHQANGTDCFMVGDYWTDLVFGKDLGMTSILVGTGRARSEETQENLHDMQSCSTVKVYTVVDMYEAAERIIDWVRLR